MIGRLLLSTLWLLIGSAISGGVYWGFLSTPESSVGALILSAFLFLIAIVCVGMTLNGALMIWSDGWSRAIPMRALISAPSIVVAILLVAAVWWIAGRATSWVDAHSGEINAWFIARFGLANVNWLFNGIGWIAWWVDFVAAPFAAFCLISRRRPTLKAFALATLWFAAFVAVPWAYLAPWRPRGIPATSVEMIFITAKLSLTFVLMAIGTSLMIREAAPHGQPVGRS